MRYAAGTTRLADTYCMPNRASALHGLCPRLEVDAPCASASQAQSEFAKSKTLQQQRRFLPVYESRDELLHLIRENQVVVVVGETGSGKTTQVSMLVPATCTGMGLSILSGSRCPIGCRTSHAPDCWQLSFSLS